MKVTTRLIIMLLIILVGCSSEQNYEDFDVFGGSNTNTNSTSTQNFNKNYVFLESNSKVQDRNFYWATLVEKQTEVATALEKDPSLLAYLLTAKKRLISIAEQENVTAEQYATALKFSNNERIIISTAIKNAVENNPAVFEALNKDHFQPSGAFNLFQDVTSISRTNQLIVEEMMIGINQIIDTYVAGIDPRYPNLDKVSFNVTSLAYKTLLKKLVADLHCDIDKYTLFYQPFLNFALGALKLNNRDEAARFVPLKDGENAKAYQNIQSIVWDDYQYSMIVVLGDAPNSAGDLPNISLGGMERCDYAVTLFKQGKAPLIAFTGSNVAPFQSKYHEAIEMKKYVMTKYNIPENKILVDPHARHTTTNVRNIGRIVYYYGIPAAKKAILSTSKSQSNYVVSSKFLTRCKNELSHTPLTIFSRLSDRDIEFTPKIEVLHLDSSDPLDP